MLLLLWLFVIGPEWVCLAADTYAERLLGALMLSSIHRGLRVSSVA